MAGMARVTINWTGFLGAPGYTNLYFRDFSGTGEPDQAIADGAVAKVHTWIQAWDDGLPNTVTLTIDPSVEVIEETTGEMVAFFTTVPGAPNVGGSTMPYSAASGACVNWYTDGVRNGRRIRGRSFMVPIGSNGMENNGTLNGTALTSWRTATGILIDGTGTGDLGVWARPTPILDGEGNPTGEHNPDGEWSVVTSYTIPDKAAVLRSRRD
jgi:hypothetical protein